MNFQFQPTPRQNSASGWPVVSTRIRLQSAHGIDPGTYSGKQICNLGGLIHHTDFLTVAPTSHADRFRYLDFIGCDAPSSETKNASSLQKVLARTKLAANTAAN